MWKYSRILAAFFVGTLFLCFALFSAMFEYRTGSINFKAVSIFSLATASLVVLRIYHLLWKTEKETGNRAKLINDMVSLSLADLSMFVSADKAPETNAVFTTVRGSANDEVLHQMHTFGLVDKPRHIPRALDSAREYASLEYALTEAGRAQLSMLLQKVMTVRQAKGLP